MLEKTDLLTSGLIELLQGTILVDLASTVMSVVETSWTSMPEEAMKLVDGVCRSVIAIHMEESCQTLDGLFPTISRVVNAVSHRLAGGGTNPLELMLTPGQPVAGFDQLAIPGTMPTTRGFHSNSVLRQQHLPPVAVARRGNCNTLFHWIEFPVAFELVLKRYVSGLQ